MKQDVPGPSTALTLLLASACGLIVANIYYAQPLVGLISASLGVPAQATGLVVTMILIGYSVGLLFVVPLGDLIETRRLVVSMLALCAIALACASLAPNAAAFFAAVFLVGIASSAAQVLVPFAAHLAPDATRGRVVGDVMSGLMLGIMLSRPAASFIASVLPWNAVFGIAAILIAALAGVLAVALPHRRPRATMSYGALIASLGGLVLTTPVLRRRMLYHACLFAAFSIFWTVAPLLLAQTFHLGQVGIALFAFAGVAGAIAAPVAGRVADRGWSRPATIAAMLAVAGAFLAMRFMATGEATALAGLALAAIVLDFGVIANLVLSQRAIYALAPEHRSRLNGIFMATFFAAGALGSALGGWSFARGGWELTTTIGLALPLVALAALLAAREKRLI